MIGLICIERELLGDFYNRELGCYKGFNVEEVRPHNYSSELIVTSRSTGRVWRYEGHPTDVASIRKFVEHALTGQEYFRRGAIGYRGSSVFGKIYYKDWKGSECGSDLPVWMFKWLKGQGFDIKNKE